MRCTVDKTYVSQVTELLQLEAEAIMQAASQIEPQAVDFTVKLLATCQGKIVFTGIGKSGIIARKIAATFTSTGTAAVYLHPLTPCTATWELLQPPILPWY